MKIAARKTAGAANKPAEGQRIVLFDISWEAYLKLGEALVERHLRMTFDQGVLEIISPSREHELYNRFLERLVLVLCEELDLPIDQGGSTTFQKEALERGLEPDSCWWIANESKVRGKKKLDWNVDPPPNLALEIDITTSSVDRMAIYAALQVPEVWRFDGSKLAFCKLRKGKKKYVSIASSLSFPGLTPADLLRFVAMKENKETNQIVRQFRKWVREHLARN